MNTLQNLFQYSKVLYYVAGFEMDRLVGNDNGSNDELVLRIIIDGEHKCPHDVDLITLVKHYGGKPDSLLGKGLCLIPLYYTSITRTYEKR